MTRYCGRGLDGWLRLSWGACGYPGEPEAEGLPAGLFRHGWLDNFVQGGCLVGLRVYLEGSMRNMRLRAV